MGPGGGGNRLPRMHGPRSCGNRREKTNAECAELPNPVGGHESYRSAPAAAASRARAAPPAGAGRSGSRGPRARKAAPRAPATLSLAEIGELVEQLPAIDWSPVIAAAARDEHRRAVAYSGTRDC